MRIKDLQFFVCPETHRPLEVENPPCNKDEIFSGILISPTGKRYEIRNGVPDLTYPSSLAAKDETAREFYEGRSDDYDKYLHLSFKTHEEDENKVRNIFIDALELQPGHHVLEIACGTGRDSEIIASRLNSNGVLCLQDISPNMLEKCQNRMAKKNVRTVYNISNACHLPFPDNFFDAVYSFGGLGEFSDIKRSLSEMARVSKLRAKIVIGDESIPPWLRETEFAKILITTNKQFLAKLPLDEMPIQAREVRLRWVIGGVFYLIDFRVGDGEPKANFDFEIPGPRGGTLRTRYLGQLEAVTPDTKKLAEQARVKRGVSMHEWLEEVVLEAALKDINQ